MNPFKKRWRAAMKKVATKNRNKALRRDQKALKKRISSKCERIFSDRTVLNGPFKGMRYPKLESHGSELFPKLLGSYEQELTDVISEIIEQPYTSIVDIGCAEGYYAVGFGRKKTEADIYAFDTDEDAREACIQMAELNQVNVHVGEFCDNTTLLGLELGDRSLIISDCEGYELELFNEATLKCLEAHDLLIEMHDFNQIETTQTLLDTLSNTHDCEIIQSVDDIWKAYTYNFAELESFSLQEKYYLLRERRPVIMRWMYARARKN